MAELDTKERDKLRKDDFAYVDRDGGEHLPINDESHVRNAMSRWNQTDFQSTSAKEETRRKILAAALVENLSDRFRPDEYRDEYRVGLEELIARKQNGEQRAESPSRR